MQRGRGAGMSYRGNGQTARDKANASDVELGLRENSAHLDALSDKVSLLKGLTQEIEGEVAGLLADAGVVEDGVTRLVRERHSGQLTKIESGEEGYEELFVFACPKFISANVPDYNRVLVAGAGPTGGASGGAGFGRFSQPCFLPRQRWWRQTPSLPPCVLCTRPCRGAGRQKRKGNAPRKRKRRTAKTRRRARERVRPGRGRTGSPWLGKTGYSCLAANSLARKIF